MKILIDIGHPAHVHYFRNFIKIMESKGHEFVITARDKEVAHSLLKSNSIPFVSRGKGKNNMLGKLIYIFRADYFIYKIAKTFKPDILFGFASPYLAHVSLLINKPCILFEDTEHAKFNHFIYMPFIKCLLTPSCFNKNMGEKQIRFNGYMELCYLYPKYFSPNINIKQILNIPLNAKYIIIRFVSWGANHDLGQSGISNSMKKKIIDKLSAKFKIFISSEGELPDEFKQFQLKINPEKLHQVLANALLYIGEGSTTASECAVLGVPNIYINSLTVGYCKEQNEKYELCYHLKNDNEILDYVDRILECEDVYSVWQERRNNMLKDKIDVIAFMVWFIENYPASFKIMKKNPGYQLRFK